MANKRNGYIIRAKDIDVKSSGALEISQSSGLGVELGVLYDGTSIKLNSSGQLSVGDISLTEEQIESLKGEVGSQGPKGDRGDAGPAGKDAHIGSVTASAIQVEASESASASVSATSSEENNTTDFAFTFKIPKGSTGPQGPQGESGASGAPGKHARIGSVTASAVTIDESSSASVEVSESSSYNEESSENITDLAFTFHIPKGVKGDKGDTGSTGSSGAPGKPARVGSVTATVSEISSDSSASVTVSESSNSDNGSENQTDLAFTFYLPKPAKGDRGERGERGDAGTAGAAGKSIKIGTVSAIASSVSYNSTPSASVSTSVHSEEDNSSENVEDFTFTFHIPAGSPGEKGQSGEAGPKGDAGTPAKIGNVTVKTSTWPETSEASVDISQSQSSGEDGNVTDLAFTFYIPRGSSGAKGEQGSSGDRGETGPAGPAGKSFKIGSVTATASSATGTSPSASVEITSSSESSDVIAEDLAFTFFIPKGSDGAQGAKGDAGAHGIGAKIGSVTAEVSMIDSKSAASASISDSSSSSSDSTNGEVWTHDLGFTFYIPSASAGPAGPAGPAGKDAKIGSVAAKVSMIPCSSEASVEVSESSNAESSETDYTFTFHIPSASPGPAGKDGSSGKDGASGASGMPAKIGSVSASIEMIATDSPASVDVVESSNSENTSENEKGFTFTFHIPSASPGPVGPAGKSGDRGETGPAGPSGSPGVGAAIRSVTASISPGPEEEEEAEEGDSATVTLVHSSESSSTEQGDVWYHDLAFTFHIPKGPKGEQGPAGASGSSGAKGDKGEHGIGMKLGSVTASVSSIESGSPASVGISWGSSSSSGTTDGEVWTHDLGFTFYLPPGPQGPKGDTGSSGSDGAAGKDGKSLKVGTVTTVTSMIPCSSSASVEVSASESSSVGDSSEVFENFTFTFHIPSGSPGPKGDAGASGSAGKDGTDGKTLRVGTVSATADAIACSSQPSVEVSISESSSEENSSELFENFTFKFHIPSGSPGARGERGERGDAGSAGMGFMIKSVTATASPTTDSPSAEVSFTNSSSDASMTYEDLAFTFYIPSGASGTPGAKGEDGKDGSPGIGYKIKKITAKTSSAEPGSPSATVSVTSSSSDSSMYYEDLEFTFYIPDGSSGASGASGSPGKSFKIGSVTATASSLSAGTTPTASVSITSSSESGDTWIEDLAFTFGIPAGSTGPAGKDAKLGSPTASASMLPPGASPTASVSSSGPESSPSFHFDFGIPGTIQAPMLMFTRPDYDSALHLEVQYKEISSIPSDEPNGSPEAEEEDKDSSEYKKLLDTGDSSTGSSDCAKVFATANGSKWYKCPSSGFGAPFGGWPVAVDLTKCSSGGEEGGFDPTKRYYIKYRWYSNDSSAAKVIDAEVDSSSKNASDWYGMVYPPATEAPLSNSHKFVTTPPLLFTCPEFEDGLYLQVEYNDNPTSSGYQRIVDTGNSSSGNCSRVHGNAGGSNWIDPPSSGFGTPFAGWPVMVDVSGLLDPSTISYIRYRWVAKEDLSSSTEEAAAEEGGDSSLSDVASDWYYMVYPAATEAPPLSYHGDEQYWVEVSDTSGTLSLSPDDGELQKFKLTSSTNLIPPTLDDIHQTLLLQFELSSSVAFMLNSSSSLMSESSGTFHVGWYWDGEKTRRYPVVEVYDDGVKSE